MYQVPTDVREAIGAFMDHAQDNGHTIALNDALETVRRTFPNLDATDAELVHMITDEATASNIRVHNDSQPHDQPLRNKAREEESSLEGWDNEGGAIGDAMAPADRQELGRRKANDTDGKRRRKAEIHSRNRLV